MKAYAVLILLFVYNVNGYETVQYFEESQTREDQWKPTPAREVKSDNIKYNLRDHIFFYLYTKDNPKDNGQRLYLDDLNALNNSSFNFNKPTKFVTHGWLNTVHDNAVTLIRDAYLQHGDYNIIAIDWSEETFMIYGKSAEFVPIASNYSANFITFLRSRGLDLSTVTIVGHSLGGHVAGLTARFVKERVHEPIALVVALDPASPNFVLTEPGQRVARGDAKYVQVIHTNAGVLGFEEAIGDIDFYPNKGARQPGCPGILDFGFVEDNICSHLRAYEYFAESINSKLGFVAAKCNITLNVIDNRCNLDPKTLLGGVNPDYNVKGVYYLTTNENSPFAKGTV